MVPLICVWSDASSDGCSVFGLFPWSDAGAYYRSAEDLLETGSLHPWACRRPLNAALLAVRLAATGHDIQWVQASQAVLLGLAIYALSRIVGQDLGWPGGLLVFSVLFAYARPYIHWLSSEWLGLTIGALALGLLWSGARDGRKTTLASGIAVLTLALHARAGTFFVLPALVLGAATVHREKKLFRWGAAALCIAGILLGFLVNGSIMKIYGDRLGLGHGNFSMTLYGLASGKPGWQQIYRDYPEAWNMPEDAQVDFAYRKSYDLIALDPSRLAKALASVSKEALSASPDIPGLEVGVTHVRFIRWLIALFFAGGALVYLWRFRGRPETTMVAAMLAGFLVSVPFLWVDGEARVYAATVPVLAVLLSFGLCGWSRDGRSSSRGRAARGHPVPVLLLVVASAALVAVAVAGPALAIRSGKFPAPMSFVTGSSDHESVVIRTDASRVTVQNVKSVEATFIPRLGRADYLLNLPAFAKEDFRRLPNAGTVYYARDWLVPKAADLQRKYLWVVGPDGMAGEKPRYLLLRGTYNGQTGVFHVSSFSPLAAVPD